MGKLRDRMEEDLKLGGYSPATQRIYLLYAREFTRYHMRSPADMGEEEIRAYLLHRIERKCSHETYRQVRAGLKFLYTAGPARSPVVARIGNSRASQYPRASLTCVRIESDLSNTAREFPCGSAFQDTCSKSLINCWHRGSITNRCWPAWFRRTALTQLMRSLTGGLALGTRKLTW